MYYVSDSGCSGADGQRSAGFKPAWTYCPQGGWEKGLNNANGFIKHEVNSRIKMRRIPDFHFIADDSTEYLSLIHI